MRTIGVILLVIGASLLSLASGPLAALMLVDLLTDDEPDDDTDDDDTDEFEPDLGEPVGLAATRRKVG
jgi:glycine/D-amino acid oxidase-like deaminating enzyme